VFLIGCKTGQAALIGSSTTRVKEIYDYTYVRNDRHSQYPVKYRTIQYLEKKAIDGQEVRLAVITLPEKIYDSSNIETIERPNKDFGLIALLSELQLLWKEKHKKPFILIERKQTPQILEEIELSLSGAISKKSYVEAGELLGATHLLFYTSESYIYDLKKDEIDILKIIDIQSGEIVAIDIELMRFNIIVNEDIMNLVCILQSINNNNFVYDEKIGGLFYLQAPVE